MWPCLARAATPLTALDIAAAGFKRLGPAMTLRLMSTTAADDFNREMAEVFGTAHGDAAAATPGAAAPATTFAAAGVPGGADPKEQAALAEVAAANSELFGLFGMSPPQEGQGQAPTAASLAQQMAALSGQPVEQGQRSSGAGSQAVSATASSSSSSSLASGLAATASSSSSSSSLEGSELTHVDASGKAAMVDVSHKRDTMRTATAGARVLLGAEVFDLVARNQLKKGDVLTVAQLAGVMGAKYTATLIPLCHNILLSKVHVDLRLDAVAAAVEVRAMATTVGPTGVEMEALTAAAVAALCVYDMCKAASKAIQITDLRLLSKSGGKSGDWVRGSCA